MADVEMEFLHRDEFLKRYPKVDHTLPAIFIDDNGEPVLWIGADEINALPSVAALQKLINEKMADLHHE
jgi:hypothetical protein